MNVHYKTIKILQKLHDMLGAKTWRNLCAMQSCKWFPEGYIKINGSYVSPNSLLQVVF